MHGKQLLKQAIEDYIIDPAANNKAFMVHKLLIKKNISTQNYCVIISLLCIIKMKKRWNLTEII